MFKTVLFPIDQSRESRDAAETVVNVVKTYGSRLVLLSVVEAADEAEAEVMTDAGAIAQLLNEAKQLFQAAGIPADVMEQAGKPAFVICDVADEINADLIIMGCRGMGLTEEGAIESVTSRVINLSPCPVLIVP